MIKGAIRIVGFYPDSIPKLIIRINKNEPQKIDTSISGRVPIRMHINGYVYNAGMRSTPRMEYLMIGPDLTDLEGNPERLSELLLEQGLGVNQKVGIHVNSDGEYLLTADIVG